VTVSIAENKAEIFKKAFDYIVCFHLGISCTVFVLIFAVVVLYYFLMGVCVGGGGL
jgi:hypothetical protein